MFCVEVGEIVCDVVVFGFEQQFLLVLQWVFVEVQVWFVGEVWCVEQFVFEVVCLVVQWVYDVLCVVVFVEYDCLLVVVYV